MNTEPLRWPIAPDGYIPNSVIRSWSKGGKGLTKANCWDDIVFHNLHQKDETITEDQEDVIQRILWLFQDEEEENEKTDNSIGKKDEEKKKEEDETDVKEEKGGGKNEKRLGLWSYVKKDTEEEKKVGRPVLLKQSSNIQPEQLKPSPDEQMNEEPQREEVFSKYSSRNAGLR